MSFDFTLQATAELSLPLIMQVLCLPPHVLHSGLVSTSGDITDTPVCWDTGPAIRSDYLGRTKCWCWWRACSKIWECRNQCGSSGPRSIDHDSLCIDNPCLVWLCAWIGRNEPPVNTFCTIFLVIPVSRPPFLCLRIDTAPAMIYNHTVKSFEWGSKVCRAEPQQ